MRLSNNPILNLRNLTITICFVFCALSGAQAQTPASNKIWTTVGSDGTVDERGAGNVFFDHSVVQMGRPLADQTTSRRRALILQQTQSAVIRYNVTPVDGLFTTTPQPCTGACSALKLTLRYLDSDSSARVVANLMEVDMATGAETVRLTFNSNNFPPANTYQVKSGPFSCGPLFLFDFRRKAYYIEATLKASSGIIVGSAAGIQMIKIETDVCP